MGVTNGGSWCFPRTRVSEGTAPGGAKSVLGGHGVEIGLSTGLHSPRPPPISLDCVLRRASGQRSLLFQCHQVVFFALSVLATLSCRTSHAWRLNALSPSSHLENRATANALWPGSAAAAPTKTHILTDVGPNCSTAEKSSTVTISIFQSKTNKNM